MLCVSRIYKLYIIIHVDVIFFKINDVVTSHSVVLYRSLEMFITCSTIRQKP